MAKTKRTLRISATAGVVTTIAAVTAVAALSSQSGVGRAAAPAVTARAASAVPSLFLGGHMLSYVPAAISRLAARDCTHGATPGLCWGGHSGTFTVPTTPGQGDTRLDVHLISAPQAKAAEQSVQSAAARNASGPVTPDTATALTINGRPGVLTPERRLGRRCKPRLATG